jgi:hypothetical protein
VPPWQVALLEIRSSRQKGLGDLGAVEHGCDHERGFSALAAAVGIRSTVQQALDRCHVAFEGRARQGRLPAIVGEFRIRAMRQENPHGIDMAVVARQHQERVAFLVAQIRRQPHAQQVLEILRLPCPGMLKDPLGEGDRLLVQFRLGRFILHLALQTTRETIHASDSGQFRGE